jgi:hypothetical protein
MANIKHLNSMSLSLKINDLPDLVLERIFSNLAGEFLVTVGLLVCKRWKQIINNEAFWLNKCLSDGKLNETQVDLYKANDIFQYKMIYFSSFDKNLIKNPCGNSKFEYWCSIDNRDAKDEHVNKLIDIYLNNFRQLKGLVEEDLVEGLVESIWSNNRSEKWGIQENDGLELLFDDNQQPVSKNFVTSFMPAYKMQVVNLKSSDIELIKECVKRGLDLKLSVRENYRARGDCGSIYRLKVMLVDEFYHLVDKFEFEFEFKQWSDAKWKLVQHDFIINKPFKYIIYIHGGSDTQHWAGFYGSKMTNSIVKFTV